MRAGMLVGLAMAVLGTGGCAASEQPLASQAEARRAEAGIAPAPAAREAAPADTSRRYGGSLGSGS